MSPDELCTFQKQNLYGSCSKVPQSHLSSSIRVINKPFGFGFLSLFYKPGTLSFVRWIPYFVTFSSQTPALHLCSLNVHFYSNGPKKTRSCRIWEVRESLPFEKVSFLIRYIHRCPTVMKKKKMRLTHWIIHFAIDLVKKIKIIVACCNSVIQLLWVQLFKA